MTAPLRSDLRGIPIAWGDSPFASLGNGRVYRAERPGGLSVAEIVASIPGLPDGFCTWGNVCINGEAVPREAWPRVRPRSPSVICPVAVTLHMPLRGGGGGGGGSGGGGQKNTFALVAAIAVLAASTLISGGVLAPFLGSAFLAGGIGATLLSTGVTLAGSLLIAALSPPPVIPAVGGTGGDESKGSASADGNVVEIGGSLPRVCGTFRVFPSPVCEPVIEIVDDNEIVTQVFALAGPHAWEDVRVASADIEAADDITVETREGWLSDPPLTLTRRQAKVALLQAQLAKHIVDPTQDSSFIAGGLQWLKDQATPDIDLPTWTPAVSRDSPDEIWLHLYWPQGLGYPPDTTKRVAMPIRFRIRRRGDAGWINLPEIHFYDHRTVLVRKAVKIIWGTAPAIPTPPTDYGPILAYKKTPQQDRALPANPPQGWVAHSHFSAGVGNDYLNTASIGTSNVRNTCLYSDRVEFYLDEAIFPKGVYDVEVKRGTSYSIGVVFNGETTDFTAATYVYTIGIGADQIGVFDFFHYAQVLVSAHWRIPFVTFGSPDQCVLARVISIWNENPVPKPGNALLCVQASNRALSQVSALASGYVRDWNETLQAWQDWTITSNPAPHFRDVLAGDLVSRAVPAVNDDRLVEWRARCVTAGFTFDAILDGRSMGEALSLLAAAGFARPRKSEEWSVIIDQDRTGESPAQIFNPRNLQNFRMEKAFADLPEGFIVTYRDRSLDYQPVQTVVYRSGFGAGNARRLEAVDYIGPVTEAAARTRATFDLAQAEARSTFYYGDADIEAIVTEAGDLVGVQHDVFHHYAGFAYIKEVRTLGGNVTGLLLDSKIPLTFPDDFFAVDELFGLNDVFGSVRGLDFMELADVFATTDIFADGAAGAGLALRLRDGSIIVKAVTAEAAEDDEIEFETPFADPGAPLAPDCLVQSGALGREYRRLILREAVPGRDLEASLVFVDEANELWAAAA